jgi:hypothetical protein
MAKHIGIWMDKRVAKIIAVDDGGKLIKTVTSEVEEFNPKGGSGSRFKGGPQDVVQDSKYLERELQQLKAYFDKVAEQLPEFDSLVVFGPSQTPGRFYDRLLQQNKYLDGKTIKVEKADSMTDNQTVAWARDYFEGTLRS